MTVGDPKVGFSFSTKDRVDFTRRALADIDSESGFDLIWVDGSTTPEGKDLPHSVTLKNSQIVEHLYDTNGPDGAIRLGLKRLLKLGYDYCGLIENDVELQPGWFTELMNLFVLGRRDGLRVGAATVRTIDGRTLIYRPQYALMWYMGASILLFTREAAKIILTTYRLTCAQELGRFYKDRLGFYLEDVWELWMDKENRPIGCDGAFAMELYRYGLSSLGTIPAKGFSADFSIEERFRSNYVKETLPEEELYPEYGRLQATAQRLEAVAAKRTLTYIIDTIKHLFTQLCTQASMLLRLLKILGWCMSHPLQCIKSLVQRVFKRSD